MVDPNPTLSNTMVPLITRSGIVFHFVSSSNISYIKPDGMVQLARHAQHKIVHLQLPPDITYDDYLAKFLPNFVKLASIAFNMDNVISIYPTGPATTAIEVLSAKVGDGGGGMGLFESRQTWLSDQGTQTKTLNLTVNSGYVLQKMNKKCFEDCASLYPTKDIGYGQKLLD
ncbi:hypothetical protein HDV01_002341 [Terramyces sp. JEL0728]|nr:hypothetical protein HDV01_002341 [Terramyces sp. JEL0728]